MTRIIERTRVETTDINDDGHLFFTSMDEDPAVKAIAEVNAAGKDL